MQLPELIKGGAQIIDVRSREEFAEAANPKSKNIPLDEIDKRVKEINLTHAIIVCCASGGRSAMAEKILKAKGFKNVFNAGAWQNTL
ncbi:MAG: rhodanese-like domain-containing protein [Oligoflexia bacterium]|nr:rhodanese-like domain-containing protein [Oligoflexia bacterium]MBF0367176.1 rhodanese-like domain-containing protein [Oligoflexia bacterium]